MIDLVKNLGPCHDMLSACFSDCNFRINRSSGLYILLRSCSLVICETSEAVAVLSASR